MKTGASYRAYPVGKQNIILSQWMGCARVIWNGKCGEYKYYAKYAQKFSPKYPPIDKTFSQFKSKELTPWLYECPSQILKEAARNWCLTFEKSMKGICGKPKFKKKSDKGSIYLTKELFHIVDYGKGNFGLFVGSKRNNIGYLKFKAHREFEMPKSVTVRKDAGKYYVSFCYDINNDEPESPNDTLDWLKEASDEYLDRYVIGLDRGIAIPVHTGKECFDFEKKQRINLNKTERYKKRLQRRLSKQDKGSNRREKTKIRLNRQFKKQANIRKDFLHKTSRKIVDSEAKVFIFENLKIKNMTKKPKPQKDKNGKFIPNKAKAKAGLNKKILNVGWYNMELFVKYKAERLGKATFKVSPYLTSQECAKCGHTHPNNRLVQEKFHCEKCGHIDNADRNAAIVIKKRAITLIKNSGTELVGKGIPLLTIGRGAEGKTGKVHTLPAHGDESSKKKIKAAANAAA